MIDGKAVIGTQRDIQEVKNAYNAYEELDNINPYSIEKFKENTWYYDFSYSKRCWRF